MNSTGRELSQADLIRNFILMGLEPALQKKLYVQFWRPMEVAFGQEAYTTHFDGFMRHYLTVKTSEIPRLDAVYDAFKTYARMPAIAEAGVEALVRNIRDFARFYCAMALGAESDPGLKLAFQDLRELKVEVAYPFLLELYQDYDKELLAKDDFLAAVRLIEAYVFRRAVCAIPTNSMNKTFATFSRVLKKDRYLESIKAHFLSLPSYRRFPADDEFRRDIQTRDLYNLRTRSYWLRRFENYGRKERVLVDEYTIEHIMPQAELLSKDWKSDLGDDWERVHQTYLHTLGNLTLTGYNSEYSNRAFLGKRDMPGGFRQSPLKVNTGLAEVEVWNEEAIKARATRLAEEATKVWRAPTLPADILVAYRPSAIKLSSYTIMDHPHLMNPAVRELFEAFRKEVLALDPCVVEEFLKLYVAYKAETNFVDVVPQAKQLRLTLNMSFSEISDPRGISKDVSGLGRWGNGDVELRFSVPDELPYVIGLVRQSLERQLGNGSEA
jgi:predicted transport protein